MFLNALYITLKTKISFVSQLLRIFFFSKTDKVIPPLFSNRNYGIIIRSDFFARNERIDFVFKFLSVSTNIFMTLLSKSYNTQNFWNKRTSRTNDFCLQIANAIIDFADVFDLNNFISGSRYQRWGRDRKDGQVFI